MQKALKRSELSPLDVTEFSKTISSPLGPLTLIATEKGLKACFFESHRADRLPSSSKKTIEHDHPLLSRSENQLKEYFAGKRKTFSIPLDLSAGTEFQRKTWEGLLQIPYGQTISYSQQAQSLGLGSNCSRAVAGANSRNTICIIIPCHRVLSSSGALHGYAAGIAIKRGLLDIEQAFV
ncbi:MAG: methylated-DNA--[protein]-cysteine S-methyltransferase [Oligoflexales bacterium]|nr:methylated-DNA--[protein]-cysteine S-methyltransferase [Oligoflexales bacterium]